MIETGIIIEGNITFVKSMFIYYNIYFVLCRSKRSRSRDRHRDRDRSSRKRRSVSRSPSKNSKDNGKDMPEVKIEREDSPQPENAIPLMPVKTKP